MAAVLVTAPASEGVIGDSIAISGTGFALSHAISVTIIAEELDADITWNTVSDGAGAWALPGTFAPGEPGMYKITATDGTSTESNTIKVSVG